MKSFARAMCLVLAVATCPRPADASGEKVSKAEQAELADWQAKSPEAAAFEGGESVLGIVLVVLLVVLIVYLIMELGENHAMTSPLDGGDAPAPPPALFR